MKKSDDKRDEIVIGRGPYDQESVIKGISRMGGRLSDEEPETMQKSDDKRDDIVIGRGPYDQESVIKGILRMGRRLFDEEPEHRVLTMFFEDKAITEDAKLLGEQSDVDDGDSGIN